MFLCQVWYIQHITYTLVWAHPWPPLSYTIYSTVFCSAHLLFSDFNSCEWPLNTEMVPVLCLTDKKKKNSAKFEKSASWIIYTKHCSQVGSASISFSGNSRVQFSPYMMVILTYVVCGLCSIQSLPSTPFPLHHSTLRNLRTCKTDLRMCGLMTLMHADADIILFFLWAGKNFADITEHMTPVNKHIIFIYAFQTNNRATYNTNYNNAA
jgi:hypothetical protein